MALKMLAPTIVHKAAAPSPVAFEPVGNFTQNRLGR
jgi:hypothetical protein